MPDSMPQVIVVGGGAAGFFGAITCAEAARTARVTILEQSARVLGKVRISGGGRCNVTHACFDPRDLASYYPRGGQALIGPFRRFQPRDTVAWFADRGVPLKQEPDGRMFPVTDSSQTVMDCLAQAARAAGVTVQTQVAVLGLTRRTEGGFDVALAGGKTLRCDQLLLATGGCRVAAAGQLAVSLGHTLVPPVPSLFTFHVATPWLRDLPGVSVEDVEVTVSPETRVASVAAPEGLEGRAAASPTAVLQPGNRGSAQARRPLRARGPLLVTHTGLSGPAILRLSAWGARVLAAQQYQFTLQVNWLPALGFEELATQLGTRRETLGARLVVNGPIAPLPARLWERLVSAAGLHRELRWSALTRASQQALTQRLTRTELAIAGKSLNQDEFVTCGGVPLEEVNFQTMESRICPGLYFAGELLDIDGLTGGFNFQAAWTTGWLAGRAMSDSIQPRGDASGR